MNSDRQRQVTSIFHSAIEREGTERRAFLDGACGDDDALRREVEELIKSHESAGSFIASPAYERGAELLTGGAGTLAGRSFGQYRLTSLLGQGGMGEVYLAEDTRLGRRVAIKVLPAHLIADQAQVARFQQEAQAASALNHPNIITVHDINEADGRKYIATEYIEGSTLRARLSRGALSLHEALDIAVQIAGALGAAHSAGVVHRDIKPENVMLRPDGYVKVLDFGIAKLTEQRRSSTDGEAPTRALVQTGQGVVMGTAHYMSPEQARGEKVDARTDIWSLGVVLYEMVAGRVPFEGGTVSDCIASILKMDPSPLTEIAPHVPARLDWVVQKTFRKDRDERYHTAKEMLSDLRAVRQEVDALAQLERSVPAATSRAGATTASGVQPEGEINPGESAASTAAATRTTSSAEYLVTEFKRHKRGAVLALIAVLVIIAGGSFLLYKHLNRNAASPIFQNVQVSRITTSGRASEANISPDGRYVVYVEDDDAGNLGIIVRQTATGNTLQIVPPAKILLSGTVFSPDSDFVYYLANDLSSDVSSLYKVPSIGGTPKKVMTDVDGPVAISPDGSRLAFVREEKDIKFDLIIASSDGTGERVIATRQGLEWFEEDGPAWSPDGKSIACAAGSSSAPSGGNIEFKLLGFDMETGAEKELSPKRWFGDAGRVIWMPGGNALALIAADYPDRKQVWRVPLPAGTATRITNDVEAHDSRSLGVTADGRTLLSVIKQSNARIELLPASGDTNRLLRLTSGEANREGLDGFAWTPDGRVVFSSYEGGQSDLWIMDAVGSGRKRLTSDIHWDGDPTVSPDGRYVVFASNRARGGGVPFLWRVDIDGDHLTQLTSGEDTAPAISPDGRWVIYSSWTAGPNGLTGQTLWKVSIDGGTPVQLTDYTFVVPSFSPDGKSIAGVTFDDQVTPKRWRNAIIPASGGRPIKQFDRPNYNYQYPRWTHDGTQLSFIGNPAVPSNIWLQPVAGGEPRRLTDFKTEMIFRHAWSLDGRSLAFVRGHETNDVVLMKEAAQP